MKSYINHLFFAIIFFSFLIHDVSAKIQVKRPISHSSSLSDKVRTLTKGDGWPACDPGVKQMSGLIEINVTYNKKYFYWAFSPRNKAASNAPVVLWMTGGPGCSSSLALLAENGPCHVNLSTGALYRNNFSWNNEATVIYIDQPAGVGFSTSNKGGYDYDENGVSEDMYWFLQHFFQRHPELSTNEFYVTGESYGGHFVPATAYKIYKYNKELSKGLNKALKGNIKINLKGIAIGNGLTAPYIQYQYYGALAYGWCKKVLGKPCVSKITAIGMNLTAKACVPIIKRCMAGSNAACIAARTACNLILMPYLSTGRNVYDIREQCENPPLCYDFSQINEFMNRADVQTSLGLPKPERWQSCNMYVNFKFATDWMKAFDNEISEMLDNLNSSFRVMIYAGDDDFICNWIGNKAWVQNMDWSKKTEFNNAPDKSYNLNGKEVAVIRSVPSSSSPIQLSFVQIHDAGHMVPMNQPVSMFSILQKFLNNAPFF